MNKRDWIVNVHVTQDPDEAPHIEMDFFWRENKALCARIGVGGFERELVDEDFESTISNEDRNEIRKIADEELDKIGTTVASAFDIFAEEQES